MRRFGLIGFPLSHSFSQKYFTGKFEKENIKDCVYENFSLPDISGLSDLLKTYPDLEGLNITIPHKQKVMTFLDEANNVVQKTGACNCIKISKGKLSGYNTDVAGFSISLQSKLLPRHRKALILGKGGAAKAVAYVLSELGIEFLYAVRRNPDEADTVLFSDLDEELIRNHRLIINTTPLGTFPEMNSFPPIPYQFISPDHYLYDLVYNPPKTVFLQKGEENGAIIQNGADMLAIQAEESWKIWNSYR